jgi:NAD(P)-dependent dehydrogenase (short-subunit alcohol dehydrogenase family)
MKLDGKIALVTGAGNGIGKAIATALGREGARILVADLENAEGAAKELAAAGIEAHGVRADITSESDVANVAAVAAERFGGLDILVNNAAIFSTLVPKPLEEISAAEWRKVMDVNTLGVFLVTKGMLPLLRKSAAPRVVNLCSGVAFKGNPLYLHYVASKGAILSMTRALARELGPDRVLVNAIAPGFTLSENVEANPALMSRVREISIAGRAIARDMYPDDLVGAAVFFSGPDSAFITGQTLVIDGGSYFH